MALPIFLSTPRNRSDPSSLEKSTSPSKQRNSVLSKTTIKKATRTRLCFALFTSFCFLVSLVFLILVEVGNTSRTRKVAGSIWFLKLDLRDIIPASVPNFRLINSIARSLGLHDFYQVGLWNFCEGYGSDITECSKPKMLYWFNPVEIILNELLSGASIALPSNIATILKLVRTVSHWMFGLFLVSAPLSFLCIILTPLSVYSRLLTLPIAILSFITALTHAAACIIATALFIIFRNVVNSKGAEININASIGIKMFVFMWISAGAAIVGWLMQMGLCCCCASRRDVKKGKKVGRKSAYGEGELPIRDQIGVKKAATRRRGWLGRKKE